MLLQWYNWQGYTKKADKECRYIKLCWFFLFLSFFLVCKENTFRANSITHVIFIPECLSHWDWKILSAKEAFYTLCSPEHVLRAKDWSHVSFLEGELGPECKGTKEISFNPISLRLSWVLRIYMHIILASQVFCVVLLHFLST